MYNYVLIPHQVNMILCRNTLPFMGNILTYGVYYSYPCSAESDLKWWYLRRYNLLIDVYRKHYILVIMYMLQQHLSHMYV